MVLNILFGVLMIAVFGRLAIFALKATWGIMKVLGIVVLLPVILIALAVGGLLYIAFPILVLIGVLSLIETAKV